ncbi:flagellar hook-associated family protein [Aurantimonas sp. HBX-1]|uniref:flagellar hook-associated family protein n=1 Tax=Aurantimonas sp. HBX-1 TaxID=2906072 RepID=UPI001F38A8FE|nr:flagellar hook-associated family protein [Aurantimonas sp. HBX-1]UIJ72892.1 flagellar hook-associated family protein [Aurantimonas sp. HBX-1]
MSNFLVSSYSLSSAPRSAVFRIQDELRTAQKEVTTGRLADVGLGLGVRTNQTVSLRIERENNTRLRESNALIGQRFETMQTALESVVKTAEALVASLISNGASDPGISASVQQAKAGLQQFSGALNSASGARFLFSGASSDEPAIAFTAVGGGTARGYEQDSTAKKATADAFQTAFGFAQDDPAVAGISPADLEAFVAGGLDGLFQLSGTGEWANWSQADGTSVYNRISESETLDVSYPASDEAFRNIAKAYVMIADLGIEGMNGESRQLLTSRAIETLSQGLAQLTEIRAEIGGKQSRLETTEETLKSRNSVLTLSIASFEEVDPYEASTQVTTLMNLLETSYALTARISRLSILNYL